MGKISFLSNIASSITQRRLGQNAQQLGKTQQQLASGQRIVAPSDDAAGLAIAKSLNVDKHVYNQGLRNLNDGISLLNVAEGALQALRGIVLRLRELGAQAANGVLSALQRQALDGEGQALISEYNRVVTVTEYNGRKLLDGSLQQLTIQAGYGESGQLTVSIGQFLQRDLGIVTSVTTVTTSGDGTFQDVVTYATSGGSSSVKVGDLNGDGKLDIVTADYPTNKVSVRLGNGNGTFQARRSFTAGTNPRSVSLGDVDGDGIIDIVSADYGAAKVSVFHGNANGTFQARRSYSAGSFVNSVTLGDVNADGKLDIVSAGYGSTRVSVYFGNGNGTFLARRSYSSSSAPQSASLGDFNGDGVLDIVTADGFGGATSIYLNNGNGTFRARVSYSTNSLARGVTTGDFNGDNKLDVVSADYGGPWSISLRLGNGNGSLQARQSYSTGQNPISIAVGDFNGDSDLDIVVADRGADGISIHLGNGNGSFQARITKSGGPGIVRPESVALGDLNGDGSLDIVSAHRFSASAGVFLGNTATTTSTSTTGTPISFLTQDSAKAALTALDPVATSIENELANIGASVSRFETAVGNLKQVSENTAAAESRITDIDVAEASAELVKGQILQDAAAAVLAQANQTPALLLKLLEE